MVWAAIYYLILYLSAMPHTRINPAVFSSFCTTEAVPIPLETSFASIVSIVSFESSALIQKRLLAIALSIFDQRVFGTS